MNRSITIISWLFFVVSLLFFLYEIFLVKNPFYDAIPASFIWGFCVLLAALWIFRLRGARSK